jgi:hypothetical protein
MVEQVKSLKTIQATKMVVGRSITTMFTIGIDSDIIVKRGRYVGRSAGWLTGCKDYSIASHHESSEGLV